MAACGSATRGLFFHQHGRLNKKQLYVIGVRVACDVVYDLAPRIEIHTLSVSVRSLQRPAGPVVQSPDRRGGSEESPVSSPIRGSGGGFFAREHWYVVSHNNALQPTDGGAYPSCLSVRTVQLMSCESCNDDDG